MSEFDEYIVHGEPEQKEKADALQTATSQNATEDNPKSNICTLDCTLEETAVLTCIETNPKMTQKEMASTIRKSGRTVETLTCTLIDKGRNGRRNGWWKI